MTEIPEHLLKRSQERRAALGGDGGDAAAATPAATPATTAAATPATAPAAAAPARVVPQGPPPVPPDSPVVAAYKRRKKIPVWAMATLALLPLWAFMYVRSVTASPAKLSGPLGVGSGQYTSCASCHGAAGEGISGYAFANGEVLKTFPHIEDQLRWVYLGTSKYTSASVKIYGDPNRPGGAHVTGNKGIMPSQHENGLSDSQILAVVCFERYEISGADAAGAYKKEFDLWCSPDSAIYAGLLDGSLTFDNLHDKVKGVAVIGTVPKAGSSK